MIYDMGRLWGSLIAELRWANGRHFDVVGLGMGSMWLDFRVYGCAFALGYGYTYFNFKRIWEASF